MIDTIFYSLTYGGSIASVVVLLFFLTLVVIWLIAHTGKYFTFIREGEGIMTYRGEKYEKSIIAFDKFKLKYDEDLKADKVIEGEVTKEGFLGFLEDKLGIYWVGFWPNVSIHEYEFRWKEWSPTEDGYQLEIRNNLTNFFFVKTFRYGSFLQAAEAKGNVSVDVKFSLFVSIICPQTAISRVEDWFLQLDDYALRRARIYVGKREFDDLRTETIKENQDELGFSAYIRELNEKIVEGEDGVIKRLGVEIISAQIIEVDIAGTEEEKSKLLAATTEKYRKEQEGEGIIALGTARAKAIAAEGKAIEDLGEIGTMLRRQQAIEKAGEGGNTVVFTSDNDSSTLTPEKFAGLAAAQTNKDKGGKNESEE